ncbi:MAG: PepSY domain-containing protein [Zoogloeaceae bacterium]|jgi:uncharacterized iron-regulated membrane protein|nr:PepSY domain-containing protein [Zoogloeaceae bacterium]
MRFDQPRGLRQSMSWLHTWSGLVLGWLLFAIFATGTLSFFRNEITFWMQPELHRADKNRIDLDRALQILAWEAPNATQWSITFPSPRNPTLGLSWQAPGQNQGAGGRDQQEGAREGASREARPARESAGGNGERPRGEGGFAAREGRPVRENAGGGGERAGREGGFAARSREDGSARREGAARSERAGRPEGEGAAQQNDGRQQGEAPNAAGGQQQARAQGGGGGGGGNRGPRIVLDPATGAQLKGRETAGGNFLYRFHFELYGMDRMWGRWIVGIATMFMFVAIISGVIVHRNIFKDFFTFRPAKGKRSWLDAHNASSVLSLPFHIVITFSGLLLFGNMLLPTAMQSAYPDGMNMRARMAQEATPPSGERAPLVDLVPLLAIADETWQSRGIGSLTIINPGDRKSIVEIRQPMAGGSLVSGRNMAESLRFDGVTGEPLAVTQAPPPTTVQAISNVFIMLHRGFFASPVPRWLLFLAGIGGALMVATGLVMWCIARTKEKEKHRVESGRTPFGHRLVEVCNVAGIAGLLLAIGAYFWANRLIPADLLQRNLWEIRVFFLIWGASGVHALLRDYKRAWIEQLAGAGFLIAALPFLNPLTGGLSLFGSISLGQGLLIGFDLAALLIGLSLFYAARKVRLHVPRVRATQAAPPFVNLQPEESA